MPIGLAYALMRDKYDEEILGRKQNVLHLGADNPFTSMLDSVARVGTFGIFGEIPNSIINVDTVREVSVDSRVFLVNTMLSVKNALSTWVRQGTADYSTVYRPLLQALGGSGYLQYADSINTALGLDNQESRVAARISVNNYLRTTGRELKMDVRTGRGMQALPNPIKPYVGQMVTAALANDAAAFREAYRAAKLEAKAEKKANPEDYVQRSFAAYHPLRLVFRTEPTEAEYQKLLRNLDDNGRVAVSTAIRLINGYSEQIGVKATVGREPRKPAVVKPLTPPTLSEIRKRAGY